MAASAKFYVSVDGGANQDGGVEVPSGAVITFVPASTVGWLRQRWEIPDYPEGWATPAGWSLAVDGTIFSEDVNPTDITLPAATTLWGKWMLRLRVNEQLDTDQEAIDDLIDETTALSMLSPTGLRDGGARETDQFCTPTTLIKQWARDYQRNLRALDAGRVSGTRFNSFSIFGEVQTTAAGTAVIAQHTIADGTTTSFDFVAVMKAVGTTAKGGRWDGKVTYQRNGGAPAIIGAAEYGVPHETEAGDDVTFDLSGNVLRILATSADGDDRNWSCEVRVHEALDDA